MTLKIGCNLAAVGPGTTAQPFLNIMHTAFQLVTRVSGTNALEEAYLAKFYLDSNGYPMALNGSGSFNGSGGTGTFTSVRTAVLNTGAASFYGNTYKAGNYVFLYDGTGTFSFGGDFATLGQTGPTGGSYGSGTGRWVLNVATPTGGTGNTIEITSTGNPANSGTDYAKNWRLVYAPTATATVIDPNETNVTAAEAGNYSLAFNPDYISKMTGFDTIRFQGWANYPNDADALWADLTPVGALLWEDRAPVEMFVALCNKLNANMWISFVPLANDTYVTNFANYVFVNLNSNLKVNLEYSNEWVFSRSSYVPFQTGNPFGSTQEHITGFIDDGSGAGSPSGVAGNILTVTAIGNLPASVPSTIRIGTTTNNMTVLADVSNQTDSFGSYNTVSPTIGTAILSQTTSAGGHNRYIVSASPQVVASKTIYLWTDIWYCMNALGVINYPTYPPAPGNSNGGQQYCVRRMVENANIFRTAFGGSSSRINACCSGFADPGTTTTILAATPAGYFANFGGSPSANWPSGTAGSHMNSVQMAGYFDFYNFAAPMAWSADSTGLNKFFLEMNSGGQLPLQTGPTVAPNALAGGSPYTLTSDADWGNGAVPATPANQTIVRFTVSGSIVSGSNLKVDGGNSFQLTNWNGSASGFSAGTYGACFTNLTASGAVSPAQWRVLNFAPFAGSQMAYPGGMMAQFLTFEQGVAAVAASNSLLFFNYEFGQQMVSQSADQNSLYISANRDAQMETTYNNWMTLLQSNGISLANHLTDISLYSQQANYYGALENVLDPVTVPKYDALMDFINPSPPPPPAVVIPIPMGQAWM